VISYLRTLKPPRRGAMVPVKVSIETTAGQKMNGLSLNRTFQDMQLLTPDNKIHLLRKEGARYRPVTSQADWPSYDGQVTGNRFSALKQIDRTNAVRMVPKWIFSLPNTPSLEVTPLVVQGIMYVTSANECYALDAGSGREIWHYQRQHTKGMEGKVSRGAAVGGDRVFMTTDHGHLIALNRFTGALLWETEMADHTQNYFGTSAPLVVGKLVVSGIGGGIAECVGFWRHSIRKPAKRLGVSGPFPRKGSPDTRRGMGNISHIPAAPPGSRAATMPT
jgi:Glucose dehydrogenase